MLERLETEQRVETLARAYRAFSQQDYFKIIMEDLVLSHSDTQPTTDPNVALFREGSRSVIRFISNRIKSANQTGE